jgi:hypothetical protein
MSFKQLNTEVVFQFPNASSQGWLCEPEVLRSGAQAAVVGNRDDVARYNYSVGSKMVCR